MKEEKKLFLFEDSEDSILVVFRFLSDGSGNNKAETEVRQTEGKVNNTKFTQTLKR